MSRHIPLEERFSLYTERLPWSGCWIWMKCVNSKGYGAMCYRGRRDGAHRFSWEFHRGPIPEGTIVCHRCDVPACVNPDHLFLGSQSENLKDAQSKGRFYKQPRETCKHGHSATSGNVYFHAGLRYCLQCKRDSRKRAKERIS